MRIGDLARKAGVAPSAIRYYEIAGVLPKPSRKSGRRIYGDEALVRLNLIAMAQATGFTLKETAELLRTADREGWRPAKFAAFAERKIAEIDAKLDQLNFMRGLLAKSKSCGCISLKDCALYAQSQDETMRRRVRR
ncbi:MAG TPA: MerR family transcriptional regulator [Rhizomicrobium sp.]|nr:MerR family transcriptional regulator [Rhizomicrobium sp.]